MGDSDPSNTDPSSDRTEPIECDWQQWGSPSGAIIATVATAMDREPTALEPLGRCVDADALDSLLDGGADGPLSVSFSYQGLDVEIDASGRLVVSADAE